eukprot:1983085-Rhodomonas_salina.1
MHEKGHVVRAKGRDFALALTLVRTETHNLAQIRPRRAKSHHLKCRGWRVECRVSRVQGLG